MLIHIIGARALNPIGEEKIQKHASCEIKCKDTLLQIDIGNPCEGSPDFLVISHLHPDHVQAFDTLPKNAKIIVPHRTFQRFIKEKFRKDSIIFSPKKFVRAGQLKIAAFPVFHASNTETFGFRIECENGKIAWISDYRRIKGCLKFIKNLDILFIGASCLERPITHKDKYRSGHMPIMTALEILKKEKIAPKRIYLIHMGKQLAPVSEKLKLLRKKFPDFQIDAAYDNMNIDLNNEES